MNKKTQKAVAAVTLFLVIFLPLALMLRLVKGGQKWRATYKRPVSYASIGSTGMAIYIRTDA